MKPCNPATMFVTGNDTSSFTYQPGAEVFYVMVNENHHVLLRVLVWADDDNDAIAIVRAMIMHARKCVNEFAAYDKEVKTRHGEDQVNATRERIARLWSHFSGPRISVHVSVGRAPRNQLYKIGFASNDTIF